MSSERVGFKSTPVVKLSFETDFDATQPSTTHVHFHTIDNVIYAVRDTAIAPSSLLSSMVYNSRRHRHPSISEPICLNIPIVKSDTFQTILKYCYFHTSLFKERLPEYKIRAWDNDFLDVDAEMLCSLAEGASVLQISPLLDQAVRAISNTIRGKSTEEIQRIFSLMPDMHSASQPPTMNRARAARHDGTEYNNTPKKRKQNVRKPRIRKRIIREESSDNNSANSADRGSHAPTSYVQNPSPPQMPSIPLHIRIRSAYKEPCEYISSDPSSEEFLFIDDDSVRIPSTHKGLTQGHQPSRNLQNKGFKHTARSFKTDPTVLDTPRNSDTPQKCPKLDKSREQQDSSESEVQFVSMTLAHSIPKKSRSSDRLPHSQGRKQVEKFVTQLGQTMNSAKRKRRHHSDDNHASAAGREQERCKSSQRASLSSRKISQPTGEFNSSDSEEWLPLSVRYTRTDPELECRADQRAKGARISDDGNIHPKRSELRAKYGTRRITPHSEQNDVTFSAIQREAAFMKTNAPIAEALPTDAKSIACKASAAVAVKASTRDESVSGRTEKGDTSTVENINAKVLDNEQHARKEMPEVSDEVESPNSKVCDAKVTQVLPTTVSRCAPDDSLNVRLEIARLEERRQNHIDRASQIDVQMSQLSMEREKIRDSLAVVTHRLAELRKQSQSRT
ncbi:E3 ubiquitin ligase complex SCF subunit sconC [Gracilariopsis chorda]|uniref:E3 ubiquitin ligase complex SCF subunit sconC n=1 Tax=Gracilariopsis chorda TaxID=448386 RepID=A0A2V3IN55_9FLOR|nr:E3 ubiquitin ligase complex SCF subunit sconC [Gracilariopsis chorda]|eukprot:PXF43511.1 E3 ubiquitin ligase complex SCF subunit sconC [Gracilariopsis chorda]